MQSHLATHCLSYPTNRQSCLLSIVLLLIFFPLPFLDHSFNILAPSSEVTRTENRRLF